MATATLTSQLTNDLLDPGVPAVFGTGNVPKSETLLQLQGSNCAAIGHSGAVGTASPVTADSQAANSNFRGCYTSPTAIVRTNKHLHVWMRDLYPVRNKSIGGFSLYTANGTTAECLHYLDGIDKGYRGKWQHNVLNIDTTTRPAADLGTLPSGNIDRVGFAGNISATGGESFTQNCYIDAVRTGGDGVGITFTGGTSGDRLTLTNCADADTAFYGLFQEINGALFVEGPLTFGSATSTTYLQDSLRDFNFVNFTIGNNSTKAVASDYYSITIADGTTGVTNIDFTDIKFSGVDRSLPYDFTVSLGTGDAYASTRTTHKFGGVITYDSLTTSTNDTFVECVTFIPTGITVTGPTFNNCDAITLNTANDLISGGTTNLHNTAVNVAFITTNALTKIASHAFINTGGTGHAIEITAIGTYSFSGNTFTGYGADASSSAAIYNNSGGLVTINIVGGGSTPTIRNGAAASTTVNNSVNVDFKVVDKAGANIASALVSVYLTADNSQVMLTTTNASGVATTTFAGTTPASIYYRIRKSSPAATKYIHDSGVGTIATSTGFSVTRTLRVDTNNNA